MRSREHGGATAVQEDAIVISLEPMNRILEVNEELALATIEPGVTYGQLNQYLKKNHPSLWSDTTDSTPNGSVIGNALEKGLVETSYGDHFCNLCGMKYWTRTLLLGAGQSIESSDRSEAGFIARTLRNRILRRFRQAAVSSDAMFA
jgi:hypothetical protein